MYDVDELDLKPFTRNKFHHCLRILSAVLTPDRLKTRWMFHTFGYDASTLEYLNTHIANNYLRRYVTADGYLLGYLLMNGQKKCMIYQAFYLYLANGLYAAEPYRQACESVSNSVSWQP